MLEEQLQGTKYDREGWFANISEARSNRVDYPLGEVTAGNELGYYAAIGRSRIDPHIHISVFEGPLRNGNNEDEFLNWVTSSDRGGPINLESDIPCP